MGELMHEGAALHGASTRYDEYFVPIPLKCIGEMKPGFWDSILSERGATAFQPAGSSPQEAFRHRQSLQSGGCEGSHRTGLRQRAHEREGARARILRDAPARHGGDRRTECAGRVQPGRHGRALPGLRRRAHGQAGEALHRRGDHGPVSESRLARGVRDQECRDLAGADGDPPLGRGMDPGEVPRVARLEVPRLGPPSDARLRQSPACGRRARIPSRFDGARRSAGFVVGREGDRVQRQRRSVVDPQRR